MNGPHVSSNPQKGAVLIVVLVLTALLALFAVRAMRTMQIDLQSATFFQGNVEAENLALSGLEYVRKLLADDTFRKNENGQTINADSLLEPWAVMESIEASPFVSGHVEFHIMDESALFPVNAITNDDWCDAFAQLVSNLLEERIPVDFERETLSKKIACRLRDWIDKDTKPQEDCGRESYTDANRAVPIQVKNAELMFVGEVKEFLGFQTDLAEEAGMEPTEFVSILYSQKNKSESEKKSPQRKGLKDLLTTHSNKKININTAVPEVLTVLVTGSEADVTDFVNSAVEYRSTLENENKLSSLEWLNKVKKNKSLDVSWKPAMLQYASNRFSAKVSGITPKAVKQVLAFLERSQIRKRAKVALTYREIYIPNDQVDN